MLYKMWLLFGFIWPMVLCRNIRDFQFEDAETDYVADIHPSVSADSLRDCLTKKGLEVALPDDETWPIYKQTQYFEGDILLPKGSDDGTADAHLHQKYTWPDAKVPYTISTSLSNGDSCEIRYAMDKIQEKTCIRFIHRTVENDYVHIFKGGSCSSHVGRQGGKQELNLGSGCVLTGIIIHELMHALGVYHEQSRTDRDDYVTIDTNNIMQLPKNMSINFVKHPNTKIQDLGLPYDFESLMHYGKGAFAVDHNKPTIEAKSKEVKRFGQSNVLSELDVKGLNLLYECGDQNEDKPSPCKDAHYLCPLWAKNGECTKKRNKQVYMHGYCQESCNTCFKCPKTEGYHQPSGTKRCFRLNIDLVTWEEAQKNCVQMGMELAKPDDADVEELSVFSKSAQIALGDCRSPNGCTPTTAWLGARGTGINFKWDRDGSVLDPNNQFWSHGYPYSHAQKQSSCVVISLWKKYQTLGCDRMRPTLCEVTGASYLLSEAIN